MTLLLTLSPIKNANIYSMCLTEYNNELPRLIPLPEIYEKVEIITKSYKKN